MSPYVADTAENLAVEGPSARFTYGRMGPRGGVPLVLLHRFPRDHRFLGPQVGIGYSTGEPRDSVEEFADSAIEFIEALGLSRADLLG
jgi:pimeloyl-ACP methyl ester carboxylesterase